MSEKASHTRQSTGKDSGPSRPAEPSERQDRWGCFLDGLLIPPTDLRGAWGRGVERARNVAADNPQLARSVKGWMVFLGALALCCSTLVALAANHAVGAWVTVGITAVWGIFLERIFYIHLAVMRSDDGKLRRTFGIPNVLTSLRLVLVPTMAYFLANPLQPGRYGEAILYTLLGLGITDILDGVLARALDQRTDFGKYTDPLTDVIVTTLATIGVCVSGAVPWWLGGLVIFRYTGAFAGFATVFMRSGTFDFQPTWLGKLCTPVVQVFFFVTTLGIIRPDLALPHTAHLIVITGVGALVAFNVIFLSMTLLRLWKIPQGDTP